MPPDIIERAKEILARLEGARDGHQNVEPGNRSASAAPAQMGLFNSTDDRLGDRLRDLNLSTMTPLEAMNVLHQLIEEVKK